MKNSKKKNQPRQEPLGANTSQNKEKYNKIRRETEKLYREKKTKFMNKRISKLEDTYKEQHNIFHRSEKI